MPADKLSIKIYDLWWNDKQKHIRSEYERIIKKHKLEKEIKPFAKTLEDYVNLAKEKLGLPTTKSKKSRKKAIVVDKLYSK